MERMLAALEPVQPAEGFSAVFEETIALADILLQISSGKEGLSHEYCHEAR
jgi:hypothetical protein